MDNTYFGLIIPFPFAKGSSPMGRGILWPPGDRGQTVRTIIHDTHLGNCVDQPPVPGSAMNLRILINSRKVPFLPESKEMRWLLVWPPK